jgi:SAM-dependent methyltransferase
LPEPPLDPPEYPLNGRYELALRWTPHGIDSVLDAGCAWGYGTRHLTQRSRDVVGLDPDPRSGAVFRRRYPHLRHVQCGLEQVPLESASFDAILVLDALEHVRDERRCLAELHRLLKLGGILIVTTPHRGAFGFLDRENLAPRIASTLRRRATATTRCATCGACSTTRRFATATRSRTSFAPGSSSKPRRWTSRSC